MLNEISKTQKYRAGNLRTQLLVLIGQEAFHPFLAKERLRLDRGLPKKAGARELGMKEGLELKVWSGVQPGGQPQPHRLQPALLLAQAPDCKNQHRILTSGLSTAKRMMAVTIY